MELIERFEKMLNDGQDSALLRFGLGCEYLKRGQHGDAIRHLREALTQNPSYSAAYKQLGKALAASGDAEAAADAYRRGIDAAEAGGDAQAAKEMRVFLKRLRA